jgi:hypothetical protein
MPVLLEPRITLTAGFAASTEDLRNRRNNRMKFTALIGVVVASNLACALASDAAESTKQPERIVARPAPPAEPKKLQATRRMLIERMKASREYLRESLPYYEQRLATQTAEVQNNRKLYKQNLISKGEFENSQQAMNNTHTRG